MPKAVASSHQEFVGVICLGSEALLMPPAQLVCHGSALVLGIGSAETTLKKFSHIVLSHPINIIKEN